jgi:hypothetical protein
MPLPALFFLIWVGVVFLTMLVKIRQIRAKGQTFRDAMQEASAKAAAQPRKPSPAFSKAGFKIFRIVGVLFILVAVWTGFSTASFIQKAARAPGQIIDFIARRGSKGGISYAPHVRFLASSGQIVVFTTRFSTQKSFWPPLGSTIGVFYDPFFPRHARMDCFGDLWFQSLLMLFFGVMFVGGRYSLVVGQY